MVSVVVSQIAGVGKSRLHFLERGQALLKLLPPRNEARICVVLSPGALLKRLSILYRLRGTVRLIVPAGLLVTGKVGRLDRFQPAQIIVLVTGIGVWTVRSGPMPWP